MATCVIQDIVNISYNINIVFVLQKKKKQYCLSSSSLCINLCSVMYYNFLKILEAN